MVYGGSERRSVLTLNARVFVCVAVLTTICRAGNVPTSWQTYRSPDYGFVIDYPANMTFYPGHPDYDETQLSFIPICDTTTVACFQYNGSEYEDTTFKAAGLSINVLRDMRTEQDCSKIDTGSSPIKTETINGIKFHYGTTGEGATSHGKGGPAYRAFYQSVCFEIASAIAATNIGAYDPGAIKQFNSTKLDELLAKMVHTFKFAGPLKDGPGWKVYYDNMCGGVYEYPEGETVQTTVEYSDARFFSDDIACSRHFAHDGLDYTVAAKVNLKDKNAFESWLKSSGDPDLSKARLVGSSKYCAEYNADSYYYIYCQATAYILSVSDAKHAVVEPRGNPVFRHWLNSFKGN